MEIIQKLDACKLESLQQTKEQIICVLESAKEQGNDTFLDALAIIAKTTGMSHISQQTGLNRENLYRSLRSGANPRYNTIEMILSALGIESKLIPKTNET